MKFQHGLMVSLVGLGLFGSLLAADPSITITRVQQRYPWNGKVDFAYTLADLEGASDFKLVTSVTAKGQTKAVTNVLDSAVTSGDYTGVVDCEALFGELIDPNASLTLKLLYTAPSPLPDDATGVPINIFGDLLVIDVSAGPTATTYPTYVYNNVDIGRFNCDVYKTNKIALRYIKCGTFMMGSPAGEPGRGPWVKGDNDNAVWKTCETRHQVTLTQDFYYGIFPITQKQWHLVMGEGAISVGGNVVQESKFRYLPNNRNVLNPDWESCPVENLFYAAVRGAGIGSSLTTGLTEEVDEDSFLGILRARTGQERLDIPTEAQWEYACRAGATTATYYGSVDGNSADTLKEYAWFSRNSRQDGGDARAAGSQYANQTYGMTHKVGSKRPNDWGLYDTLGNVFEICRDRANPDPSQNDPGSGPQVDPLNRFGHNVILRGGDWYQDWDAQRCAGRSCDRNFTETNPCTGFRLGSWGVAKGSDRETEDTHPMSLDIREVRVIERPAEETFQHSSSFWGEQPQADGATVTYVKDGGSETTTFGTFSDGSTCLWSPEEAGVYAFTHAPGDGTLYSKATYVVMPGPVTALWITDHFDAGAGFVHLAFQPLFGGTVVKGEVLGLWCEANKSRFQAVSGSTHQNIESATPIPIAPRAGKWNQDLDKGWLWVTVPVGTVDPDRYWKLRIDAK